MWNSESLRRSHSPGPRWPWHRVRMLWTHKDTDTHMIYNEKSLGFRTREHWVWTLAQPNTCQTLIYLCNLSWASVSPSVKWGYDFLFHGVVAQTVRWWMQKPFAYSSCSVQLGFFLSKCQLHKLRFPCFVSLPQLSSVVSGLWLDHSLSCLCRMRSNVTSLACADFTEQTGIFRNLQDYCMDGRR